MKTKQINWLPFIWALALWRAAYAYWTPLVNQYLVPPGDDPVFHIQEISDLLSGNLAFFHNNYPLGFHLITALFGTLFHLSALEAIRLFAPILLIVPIFSLFALAKTLFSPKVAIWTITIWSLLALAPIRTFGDGTYPNLLAGSVIVPLLIIVLVQLFEKSTWPRLLRFALLATALILTHHLSIIYLLVATFPWLIWQTHRYWHGTPSKRRLVRIFLFLCILFATAWYFLLGKNLLTNYVAAFLEYRSFAPLLGTFSTPVTLQGMLEINNPLFMILGGLGLVLLVFDQHINRSLKILFGGWITLFLVLSQTALAGLPGRFAYEIAVPLSVTAGFGAASLTAWIGDRIRSRHLRVLAGIPMLTIILFTWYGSFSLPYALPDPFNSLTRVQHDEEPGIALLGSLKGLGGTVLANNSNFYLPYLIDQPVIIARSEAAVLTAWEYQDIRFVYIGARPPLTPENIYPLYANFDKITGALEKLPNLELIKQLKSGTRIYQVSEPY